jgi:hypothetical protein
MKRLRSFAPATPPARYTEARRCLLLLKAKHGSSATQPGGVPVFDGFTLSKVKRPPRPTLGFVALDLREGDTVSPSPLSIAHESWQLIFNALGLKQNVVLQPKITDSISGADRADSLDISR